MSDLDRTAPVRERDDGSLQSETPPPDAGDLELIRWTLSLSVDERLAVLQDFVDTFWTPEHG